MDDDAIAEARVATLSKRFPSAEREDVVGALIASGGDLTKAAAALGSRSSSTRLRGDEEDAETNDALRRLFELLDADHDGFLVQSESDTIARAFGCNAQTFWQLLSKYDANADGLISLEEFCTAMKGRVWSAFFHSFHGDGGASPSVCEEANLAHARVLGVAPAPAPLDASA